MFVFLALFLQVCAVVCSSVPIVFVYVLEKHRCKWGLPGFITHSLMQSIISQPNSTIVLVVNLGDCNDVTDSVKKLPGLLIVNGSAISSQATKQFMAAASTILQSDHGGELWINAALRFFILEDLMRSMNYEEALHIEADNMLYGDIAGILPALRLHYPCLAATPLNTVGSFTTASVFWIANAPCLSRFNRYLLRLTKGGDEWHDYLAWLRNYECCRPGGIDPDQFGNGIKPFAINEMSMLAYYHRMLPLELAYLPIIPIVTGPPRLNRFLVNISDYSPGGKSVGFATGAGVWDPGSWGQYLGGTHSRNGRDKNFTDKSHIVGLAIRTNSACTVSMRCADSSQSNSFFLGMQKLNSRLRPVVGKAEGNESFYGAQPGTGQLRCVTAPFVQCDSRSSSAWSLLWNLHVHSKDTWQFRSVLCPCL